MGSFVDYLVRVRSVVPRLGKHERGHDNTRSEKSNVEPPEAAPADVIGHDTIDDRTELYVSELDYHVYGIWTKSEA